MKTTALGFVPVFLAALCAAAALRAADPATPHPATAIKPGDTVVVVRDKVRFSLGSKLLAELAKGTEFRVTSVNGDWVGGVIDIAGKQEKGWVKSAAVKAKSLGAARVAENKVPPTSGPAKPTPPPPQINTPASQPAQPSIVGTWRFLDTVWTINADGTTSGCPFGAEVKRYEIASGFLFLIPNGGAVRIVQVLDGAMTIEVPNGQRATLQRVKNLPANVTASGSPADPAKPTPPPQITAIQATNKLSPGQFDSEGAKKGAALIGDDAKQHVVDLGLRNNTMDAFLLLYGLAAPFVRDNEGNLNDKVDKASFSSAVKSITKERLAKGRELIDVMEDRTPFVALLWGTVSFMQTRGTFNSTAFAAAFENLDGAQLQRAAKMMATTKAVAMTHLLRISGQYVDAKGNFTASLFNDRFNALQENQITGSEDERIATFRRLMKPDKSGG